MGWHLFPDWKRKGGEPATRRGDMAKIHRVACVRRGEGRGVLEPDAYASWRDPSTRRHDARGRRGLGACAPVSGALASKFLRCAGIGRGRQWSQWTPVGGDGATSYGDAVETSKGYCSLLSRRPAMTGRKSGSMTNPVATTESFPSQTRGGDGGIVEGRRTGIRDRH